jgi:hypothetical protein
MDHPPVTESHGDQKIQDKTRSPPPRSPDPKRTDRFCPSLDEPKLPPKKK